MTTTQTAPRAPGTALLVRTAALALAVGLVVAVIGAVLDGGAAFAGALVGSALVTVVFAFGTISVNLVAHLVPTASLLVALLTYTLQLVLLAAALIALARSGAIDSTLSRGWLAGGLFASSAVWIVGQIVLATRARVPLYDLPPSDTGPGAEASTE